MSDPQLEPVTELTPTTPAPITPAAKKLSGSNWGRSTRETIESIAIAFALAFLFKTFEAEAFVIPTGSMAPTLMGRHKDVICPECGFRYSASGSEEADRDGNEIRDSDGNIDTRYQVTECTCPVCRFPMSVDPLDPDNAGPNAQPSYSGDRVWVSKVPYHFSEPKRWDVIVFRFPEEAQTYYIKRLVGLPRETLKIQGGDILARPEAELDFEIQRKPPDKVRAMAQVVHDNDHVSEELRRQGWPLRWQPWTPGAAADSAWQVSDDTRTYTTGGSSPGDAWIRYQHVLPSQDDWSDMIDGRWSKGRRVPPQLITDYYAFNSRVQRGGEFESFMLGLHWVGDLMLDAELDVQGTTGVVMLDLVKGGRHFRCAIDVADGQATLTIDGLDDWQRTAQTAVIGKGKHRVMFANVDQQLLLWVDDKVVTFDSPATYDDLDNNRPQSTADDAGDLAPLGIGSRGVALSVTHLRVRRDIYYVADWHERPRSIREPIHDYDQMDDRLWLKTRNDLAAFFSQPERWTTRQGRNIFDDRRAVEFPLAADQFFVLGDNSPYSADARLWGREQFVSRDLLVGKALFIYWPHTLPLHIPGTNVSLPVLPNFPGMGFIR